jgi:hypothetical protein
MTARDIAINKLKTLLSELLDYYKVEDDGKIRSGYALDYEKYYEIIKPNDNSTYSIQYVKTHLPMYDSVYDVLLNSILHIPVSPDQINIINSISRKLRG